MVSVVMITYNHEKYIAQAIDGVLMQKTNFPVELIIANDHSPDNTDTVVKNIIENYKGNVNIRYYNHETNEGMMKNFVWTLQQAQGKYIAICEGDDFWTDPYKLQKQVDFLESHPDYVICGTGVKRVDVETGNEVPSNFKKTGTLQLTDILYRNQITTCTAMFRNLDINKTILPNHHKFTIGDWQLWAGLMQFGKAYNMPEVTAQYNIHGGGMVSGRNLTKTLYSKLHDRILMLDNFPQHKKIIKKHGNRIILHYIKQSLKLKSAYVKALWQNKILVLKYLLK